MQTLAERDPELFKPYLDRFAADYAGKTDPHLPTVSPVFADYVGMTSAFLVLCGSEEILLDDSRRVVEKAKTVGATAELKIYDKGFHGWLNMADVLPEAVLASKGVAKFVVKHLGDEPR